jgi:hypothetical protein
VGTVRRRLGVSIATVVAVAGATFAAGQLAACGDETGGSPRIDQVDASIVADYDYVIPAGSGARIDRGEELDIFPTELDAKVGQTIRIVNDDDRGHNIGPFYVGADSTLTQRFASPGRFIGVCSVHPSGQFVLQVSE